MRMTAFEKHFVNSPRHTAEVARHAQQLLDRIPIRPASRYLDVGCGVGSSASEIANTSGLDVTGIDVDPLQIDVARSRPAHSRLLFMVMDATRLQFDDAQFDVVASSMVTHHLPHWETAFSEMIRVLRPGGYLLYTDFMLPSWLAAIGRRLQFVGIPSRRTVESLASQAGLTEVHYAHKGLRADFVWLRK